MKFLFSVKIISLLLALFLCAPICFAQAANQPDAANQNSITQENDHLPFMQTEQAASAQSEPGTGGLLLKTLGAMLLIVGLIFVGAWTLKKFGFGNVKATASADVPDLAILSSVSLGSGRTISTVKFGARVLLVGSTAQSFTLLADEFSDETNNPKITENLLSPSPRSVAELLDEENVSFAQELNAAQNKLHARHENGGQI